MTDRAPEEGTPPRLRTALSAGAFAVFVILLTVSLGEQEFWTDETITRLHVSTYRAISRDPFHPIGYYLLLHGWVQVFGDGDLTLRAFSIPWAILAFILATAIGRRTLRPSQVLIGQWLIALSPFVVLYFRMARYFSMTAAAALVVAYCGVLASQRGLLRHWVAVVLSSLALLMTDYIASSMLVPFFMWLGVVSVRRGQLGRFAGSAVATLVLAAPVLGRALASIRWVHGGQAAGAKMSVIEGLAHVGLPAYSLLIGETTFPWRVYITLPAIAAAGYAFVRGMLVRRREPGWQMAKWAWPLSVVAILLAMTLIARKEPLSAAGRTTIFAAPLAYLVVAAGITAIGSRRLRAVVLAVILVSDIYGLMNYFGHRQFLNYAYIVPWRTVASTIVQRQQPSDRVFTYYDATVGRYGDFAHFVNRKPEDPSNDYDPHLNWPEGGYRLWIIARDRGSAQARRMQDRLIRRLRPLAAEVQVYSFMPYGALERRMRSLFLGRQMADAYVKVYLLKPPPDAAEGAERDGEGAEASG